MAASFDVFRGELWDRQRELTVMDDTTWYLNTDLEISSSEDLTGLASALVSRCMWPLLEAIKGDDGLWRATFETETQFEEPEPNIAAMVEVIEALQGRLRQAWFRCAVREFNIGYDCGSKPSAFNQVLSSELLGRMSAIGASLRLTLYPPDGADDGSPSAAASSPEGA